MIPTKKIKTIQKHQINKYNIKLIINIEDYGIDYCFNENNMSMLLLYSLYKKYVHLTKNTTWKNLKSIIFNNKIIFCISMNIEG